MQHKDHPIDASACWIDRAGQPDEPNRYTDFRRVFKLGGKPKEAVLRVAVDTSCAVFINGYELAGRPFTDYPRARSFSAYEIAPLLKKGENTLAVLAYFCGEDFSTYRKGRAGLLLDLRVDGRLALVSDADWKARPSRVFRSGAVPKVSAQLGFTVEADGRGEDGWTEPGYRLGRGWKPAVVVAGLRNDYWAVPHERPLPELEYGPIVNGRAIQVGQLVRLANDDGAPLRADSRFIHEKERASPIAASRSAAQAVACDFRRVLPVTIAQGQPVELSAVPRTGRDGLQRGGFAIFDLGEESFGLLRLRLDAPKGTVVEIAHGEHLDDLGVRAFVGGREFADRYVCREGDQVFVSPFRRLGCRYLQLHVTGNTRPVRIEEAGLVRVAYPVERRGSFSSDDTLLAHIREAAIHTVECSMAEHFADAPWREQSLYAWDSRNSALYTYYTFGEYDFAREAFRLLGQGQREDGLLELCAPARVPVTIPGFSLIWVGSVRDNALFSGSFRLFEDFSGAIDRLIDAFLARSDKATGLYRLFEGEGYWAFYEWASGLDFKNGVDFGDDGKFRLDAPHNLLLLDALTCHAELLGWTGREAEARRRLRQAAALGRAIRRAFWDRGAGCYASFVDRRKRWHHAELTQNLALVCGLGTQAERAALRLRLSEGNEWVPSTLSGWQNAFAAMLGAPPCMQARLLDQVRGVFGAMLFQGSTTLWETEAGAEAFDRAGSLCHAWSSVPIWLTQAYLLGIRPLDPGFARFAVQPHACGLPRAQGVVPTPRGPITVAWQMRDGVCEVDLCHPRGLEPVLLPVSDQPTVLI